MLSIRSLTRTIGRSILSTRMASSGPVKTDLDGDNNYNDYDFMNENDHADNQEFNSPNQNQQQFDVEGQGPQEGQEFQPRRRNMGYYILFNLFYSIRSEF